MSNRFILNETSYHGAGAIQSIPAEVKSRKLTKAFVCSDPDLVKFGVTKKVTDVLEAAGLDFPAPLTPTIASFSCSFAINVHLDKITFPSNAFSMLLHDNIIINLV